MSWSHLEWTGASKRLDKVLNQLLQYEYTATSKCSLVSRSEIYAFYCFMIRYCHHLSSKYDDKPWDFEVDTGHWNCPRTVIGTLRSVTSSNPECPVEPPVFQGTACIEILEMSECAPAIVGTLKPPTTGVILTVDHDKESKNSQDLSCVLCLQRKDLKSNLQGEKHHPLQAVNEVEEIGGKVRVERDAI